MTIPFDPPSGRITHEYRVFVGISSSGLMFHTKWYISSHARAVHSSLLEAYPDARILVERRRIAGEIEVVD